MGYRTDILLEGAHLSIGENIRVLCPACGGGKSSERSLSITLGEDGVLRWQCFRAHCDLPSGGGKEGVHASTSQPVQKKRATFEGVTQPLRQCDLEWIERTWGITDPEHWYYTPEKGGRIAMSVRSPKFLHRGWVLRDITGLSGVKALTYIDNDEEGLAWYKTSPFAPTVVVEDIPSAVRAATCGVNAVALLGTGVGLNRAIEIGENSQHVIMALDNDAISLSFNAARRHALLWGTVDVLPLNKDMKDMKEDELRELLSRWTQYERETRTSSNDKGPRGVQRRGRPHREGGFQ